MTDCTIDAKSRQDTEHVRMSQCRLPVDLPAVVARETHTNKASCSCVTTPYQVPFEIDAHTHGSVIVEPVLAVVGDDHERTDSAESTPTRTAVLLSAEQRFWCHSASAGREMAKPGHRTTSRDSRLRIEGYPSCPSPRLKESQPPCQTLGGYLHSRLSRRPQKKLDVLDRVDIGRSLLSGALDNVSNGCVG